MYDIIVVGAGPAGMTAALYALRADKKVLLIEKETFGGQITYSPKVENYPSVMQASGNEIAEMMLDQVMSHGVDIEMAHVRHIETNEGVITVQTDREAYEAKAVIIAAGSRHRHLGLPNEEKLIGEGISYCAVCDGAFYAGKTVAEIAKLLKLHEYKTKLIAGAAARTDPARLCRAVALAVEADAELKRLRGDYSAIQKLICAL